MTAGTDAKADEPATETAPASTVEAAPEAPAPAVEEVAAPVPVEPPVEVASTSTAPEPGPAAVPVATFDGPRPVSQDKPQAERKQSVYTKEGLLGPVRVGPSVGAGAPDGMRFSLFATYKGLVTAGGAFSTVPTMGVPGASPAQIGRTTTEGFVRIHPFRGALFLGVAGGVAKTTGATSGDALAGQEATRVDLKVKTNVGFIAPHIGARWMLPFGMTAGLDVGVEIPVSPGSPEVDASNNGQSIENIPGKAKIDSALRFASHTVIPSLHLIELGYAF